MKYVIMIISLCCFTTLFGQNKAEGGAQPSDKKVDKKVERNSVRSGNKLYSDKKYTESEIEYRKALDANPESWIGMFNRIFEVPMIAMFLIVICCNRIINLLDITVFIQNNSNVAISGNNIIMPIY